TIWLGNGGGTIAANIYPWTSIAFDRPFDFAFARQRALVDRGHVPGQYDGNVAGGATCSSAARDGRRGPGSPRYRFCLQSDDRTSDTASWTGIIHAFRHS